jgi:hypothetical protein
VAVIKINKAHAETITCGRQINEKSTIINKVHKRYNKIKIMDNVNN